MLYVHLHLNLWVLILCCISCCVSTRSETDGVNGLNLTHQANPGAQGSWVIPLKFPKTPTRRVKRCVSIACHMYRTEKNNINYLYKAKKYEMKADLEAKKTPGSPFQNMMLSIQGHIATQIQNYQKNIEMLNLRLRTLSQLPMGQFLMGMTTPTQAPTYNSGLGQWSQMISNRGLSCNTWQCQNQYQNIHPNILQHQSHSQQQQLHNMQQPEFTNSHALSSSPFLFSHQRNVQPSHFNRGGDWNQHRTTRGGIFGLGQLLGHRRLF